MFFVAAKNYDGVSLRSDNFQSKEEAEKILKQMKKFGGHASENLVVISLDDGGNFVIPDSEEEQKRKSEKESKSVESEVAE